MEIIEYKVYFASTALLIAFATLAYMYFVSRKKETIIRPAFEVFNYLDIQIVPPADSKAVIENLRSRSKQHNALGFDCEWVTGKSGRLPVSLLQLATFDGYSALFRLNLMEELPPELVDLLKDRNIFKVGVAPHDDARYLTIDHGLTVYNTLDIRHLVEMIGENPTGLGNMSGSLLGVALDKRRRTRCSDWEAPELTQPQIHYAASDAHAAIRIFVRVLTQLRNRRPLASLWSKITSKDIWSNVNEKWRHYADLNYKFKHTNNPSKNSNKNKDGAKDKSRHRTSKGYVVRKKPLYDNSYMQAPDGQLLCTCDSKKALWYVSRDLADVVSETPLVIRLRFEPQGRSVGDVGKFYQMEKENKCVVCGAKESNIRKNVVPREYRKWFPDLMKSHTSHDILLLCVWCHRRSNAADRGLRETLADTCAAPIVVVTPHTEELTCKKIRNCARALLNDGRLHRLPGARRAALEATLLAHYAQHAAVTEHLLLEAVNLTHMNNIKEYTSESHGQTVVEYFMHSKNGLLDLETLWRQHFLEAMTPKFMPELWSLNHNEERLYIKYQEGRVNDEDLTTIGVRDCKW